MKKKPAAPAKPLAYPALITGIGALLEESRRAVIRAANCFMTATYWEVGRRIVEFEQGGKWRAEYGEELLKRLAEDLTARHGRGFGVDNLQRFRRFAILHPAQEIYATLSRNSSTREEAAIFYTLSEEFSIPLSISGATKILPIASKEAEFPQTASAALPAVKKLEAELAATRKRLDKTRNRK